MARRYLFVCSRCSAAVESDTERLPDGWLIISAVGERREPGPPLKMHQLDLCSAACAVDALSRAPELTLVARPPLPATDSGLRWLSGSTATPGPPPAEMPLLLSGTAQARCIGGDQ